MKKNLSSVIDFLFSKDSRKYLLLAVLIGAIIRFIVLLNVGPLADESVHGVHAINIVSSGVINEQNQAPVWFYLTDFAYTLFGVNPISMRFLSFFFGTLTIILVFLIGKQAFNERVGLVAAFLMAFSGFQTRFALEMDAPMMFFVLLAFYFFIKELQQKNRLSLLSVVFLSIAILFKSIAILFILPLAAYLLYFSFKQSSVERKKIIKSSVIAVVILFLFATPILAYNYILYTQKGITDVLFSRFFNVSREIYSSLQGFDDTFSISGAAVFFPLLIKNILLLDPLVLILSLFGVILAFYKQKQGRFFFLFNFFPILFLMGAARNSMHFVSFIPMLAVFAALTLETINSKINFKHFILLSTGVILILNLILLTPHLTSQAATFQMRAYAEENIKPSDLVIADARIYRGRIAWMFHDKAYLESSFFPELLSVNDGLTGSKKPTQAYFVECAADDCGWGTIKDQPEFNQSVEQLFDYVKANAIQEKVLYGGGGYGTDEIPGQPTLIIYKAVIELDPSLFATVYSTHDWFYYPVRWAKDDWYDKYYPQTTFQTFFNSTGKTFLWLAIIIALLSPILLIYELFRQK